MSAKNDTVDDYLSHLDEPRRGTLEALRCAILEVVPRGRTGDTAACLLFGAREDHCRRLTEVQRRGRGKPLA